MAYPGRIWALLGQGGGESGAGYVGSGIAFGATKMIRVSLAWKLLFGFDQASSTSIRRTLSSPKSAKA
jgi:hypothetical protein